MGSIPEVLPGGGWKGTPTSRANNASAPGLQCTASRAVLIARIDEVFSLLCQMCGGQMRIIAFITHSADIRHILDHIGADSEPPRISPARGPPLWDDCSDAQMDDGAQTEPADWDLAAQPAPDFEVDQRISW